MVHLLARQLYAIHGGSLRAFGSRFDHNFDLLQLFGSQGSISSQIIHNALLDLRGRCAYSCRVFVAEELVWEAERSGTSDQWVS